MNMKKLAVLNAALCCGIALLAVPVTAQSSTWTQRVHSLMRDNFSYPRSAMVRKEQGQATVRVSMSADGNIIGVTLTKSSGSEILDREAVRIAQKVRRFPTPPAGTTSVSLPISFRLD